MKIHANLSVSVSNIIRKFRYRTTSETGILV